MGKVHSGKARLRKTRSAENYLLPWLNFPPGIFHTNSQHRDEYFLLNFVDRETKKGILSQIKFYTFKK